MPFISIKTNKEITKEKELIIKQRLGEAITIVGKSESWLMMEFQDKINMYFKGLDTPCAYIEIKLYGSSNSYNEFTNTITNIISNELDIDPSRIYVSYFETNNWGYNGNNF